MIPLSNSVLIKAEEDRVKKGIYIPETIDIKGTKWGVIVDGNDEYFTGQRVLFSDAGSYEEDGVKVVSTNKIIIAL